LPEEPVVEEKPIERADTLYISRLIKSRVKQSDKSVPEDKDSSSIYNGLSFGPTIRRPRRDKSDSSNIGNANDQSAPDSRLLVSGDLRPSGNVRLTPIMEKPDCRRTSTHPDVPQDIDSRPSSPVISSHSHPPFQTTPPPLPQSSNTSLDVEMPIAGAHHQSLASHPPPSVQEANFSSQDSHSQSDELRFQPPTSFKPSTEPSHVRSRPTTPDELRPSSRLTGPRDISPQPPIRPHHLRLPPKPPSSERSQPLTSAFRTSVLSPTLNSTPSQLGGRRANEVLPISPPPKSRSPPQRGQHPQHAWL
jgi:hypothetical protein